MKDKTIITLSLFLFFFFSASNLCADLGRYETDIIKTAFMNGCVRTLSWDLERIQYVKGHPEAMKEHVEYTVKVYMTEVSKMNGEPYVMEVVGGSTGTREKKSGWLW